jgi:uncharacterized protein YxeA
MKKLIWIAIVIIIIVAGFYLFKSTKSSKDYSTMQDNTYSSHDMSGDNMENTSNDHSDVDTTPSYG